MDVGLHLAHRHAERVGDVLVAGAFEVEEHERNALMIGKPPQRLFQLFMPRGGVRLRRLLSRRLEGFAIRLLELAEEPPACAITREVIEAGVRGDSPQPAGGRRARADGFESLECLQEHRLRHVFGLRRVAEQPDGRGVHQVLIPPHEGLELVGVGHSWDASTRVTAERTPEAAESFSRCPGMPEHCNERPRHRTISADTSSKEICHGFVCRAARNDVGPIPGRAQLADRTG